MRTYLAISVVCGLAAGAAADDAAPGGAPAGGDAAARPARPAGSFLVGIAAPDALFVVGGGETMPLPALRVTWQVTPRLGLDLGGGWFPRESDGDDILEDWIVYFGGR